MDSYWKQVLHVVTDYVKDLRPVNYNGVAVANPDMDARALYILLNGDVKYLYARNGNRYLYCFVNDSADIDVVKFILKSNGMNPRLHISRYYPYPMLAFRVPASDFKNNDVATMFKKSLLDYRMNLAIRDAAVSRLQEIRNHIAKQRTK